MHYCALERFYLLNIFCVPSLTNFSFPPLASKQSSTLKNCWKGIPHDFLASGYSLSNLYSILVRKGNMIWFPFWEGCLEYSKSIIFLLLEKDKILRISSGHHVVLPLPSIQPSIGIHHLQGYLWSLHVDLLLFSFFPFYFLMFVWVVFFSSLSRLFCSILNSFPMPSQLQIVNSQSFWRS